MVPRLVRQRLAVTLTALVLIRGAPPFPMAYDPLLPANGSPNSSAEMRAQLQGLHAEILSIPVGPQGPAGPQGPQGEQGPQGDGGPIGPQGPEGPAGPAGPQGNSGNDGFQGPTGPQGPPGPDGPAGPTGPQGAVGPDGPAGPAGPTGAEGPQGPQGNPGEVSNTQLTTAISDTARNPTAVADLSGLVISDPPTRDEMETMRQKINELVTALRR